MRSKAFAMAMVLMIAGPMAASACYDFPVFVDDTYAGPGETAVLTVSTPHDLNFGEESILSFQFTLHWDPTYLTLDETLPGSAIPTNQLGEPQGVLEVVGSGAGWVRYLWSGWEFLEGPGSFLDFAFIVGEGADCFTESTIWVDGGAEFVLNEDHLCGTPTPGTWHGGTPVDLGIHCYYWNNAPSVPVPDVVVDLVGYTCDYEEGGMTDESGWAEFVLCPGCCYEYTPYKADFEFDEFQMAIDWDDVSFILDHVLNGTNWNSDQITCGDVSQNGSVTEYDAGLVMRWIFNGFFPGSFSGPPQNHAGEWIHECVGGCDVCVDENVERAIEWWLVGDPNGSYSGYEPPLLTDDPVPVTVTAEELAWTEGMPLSINVDGGVEEIRSGALCFNYDASRVTLVEMTPGFEEPGFGYWRWHQEGDRVVLVFAYGDYMPMPEHLADLVFTWDDSGGEVPIDLEFVAFDNIQLDATLVDGSIFLPADDLAHGLRPGLKKGPIAGFHTSPNPVQEFSTSTVNFSLSAAMDVDLAIFDVSGRRVRTLIAGPLGSGDHAIDWDGRADRGIDLGSGIYFARLRAGETVLEQRLLKIR
ncbi:MAG: T9SS type A sorting domain-containing protein [Candidatus Eisenbacteria bacterium]|nr:T9SS type A sorting domain-containing protein [Candidatus Eisenbacteria bacterium]